MTGRIPGRGLATGGYWGRNPRCNVRGWQLPDRIEAQTRTQLRAMGRPARLWLPVSDGLLCTCNKDASGNNDVQCRSCHGTGYVPGFRLFLYETLAFSSAEPLALVGCVLDRSVKPHRIALAETSLTGTATSDDKPYENPQQALWDAEAQVYLRPGTTALVEVSTDLGASWTALAAWLATTPPASGLMRVRVTLTRTTLDDESPEFEIVRLRHLRAHHVSGVVTGLVATPEWTPGEILILRPAKAYQVQLDASRGPLINAPNQRAWTTPLDAFDRSIERNTPDARVPTPLGDPHPFVELRYGLEAGTRFAMVDLTVSEETLTFTRQFWSERIIQPDEAWSRVW